MSLYLLIRMAHILGACVLLGTGAGIAFFMLMAHSTRDPKLIAHTAQIVVIADLVFTATAVLLQPITGALMAGSLGYPLLHGWVGAALILYVVTGLCWLPVVAIQIRLRDLARDAATRGEDLPPLYDRLFGIWFALGIPAFAAVLGIVWLMVARPDF